MNKQELFETMLGLWNEFEAQHNGTTKKSQQQARKSVGELKKLVTDYRKAAEHVAEMDVDTVLINLKIKRMKKL